MKEETLYDFYCAKHMLIKRLIPGYAKTSDNGNERGRTCT